MISKIGKRDSVHVFIPCGSNALQLAAIIPRGMKPNRDTPQRAAGSVGGLISCRKGFSFIEAMTAVVIFSVSVVAIYRSYILSLERMNYLTRRLYATVLLDDRLVRLERILRAYQVLPVDIEKTIKIDVADRPAEFQQRVQFQEVEDYADIFQTDLTLSWQEGEREISVSRAAYISDFYTP